MNFSPILNITIRTARDAGRLAMRFFERPDRLTIEKKGSNDLVTNADIAVEEEIIQKLQRTYPDYGFLGEESGSLGGEGQEWRWIIDPIDGTTNFSRGIPHFAISIALAKGDQVMVGVVLDPVRDEIFAAERGRGAFLNEFRIRVPSNHRMEQSLLATGFPFKQKSVLDPYLATFRSLFVAGAGVRRAGCASLDLAYTAAGRFDGFWEMRLAPWDIAAGSLLVQEAGGFVSDFQGEGNYLEKGDILAANPTIHKKMLTIIQDSLHEEEMRRKNTI